MNMHSQNYHAPLPDAIEAEQALLGAILVNNDALYRVSGFLSAEHFAEPIHQEIFAVASSMINEGRAANPVTIKPYLPAGMQIGDMTIMQYVASLAANAVTVINAYDYGRAIIEIWSLRQLIGIAQDLDRLARNMPVNMTPEKIISDISDKLTRVAQEGNEKTGSAKYGAVLARAIDRVGKESLNPGASLIHWCLPEIEDVLGPIRRGNLIGFMSDSGGGKTSFSLQQCHYTAKEQGLRSAFFSIEITDEEAALQAAAQAAYVPLERLDGFNMDTREKERIEKELMGSAQLPFDIVSFANCSLTDIRTKAEAMKKSVGLDLIFIDHAKMINLPGKAGELFAARINALYYGLKQIAKALNIAIVILIQRNEEWKLRMKAGNSPRPIAGDAYGGGSVQQSLDVWFSLYRPEVLLRQWIEVEQNQDRRDELVRKFEKSKGFGWIINHKRRRGEPAGDARLKFEAEYTRFTSAREREETAAAFEGVF